MTLNDMSAQHNSLTGNPLGFTLKSKKTGKVFQAIAKAVDGKWVITYGADSKKMFAVSGTEDRYEFATSASVESVSKKAELEAKLSELQGKETELVSSIESMEETLESVQSQIYEIEDMIDELG